MAMGCYIHAGLSGTGPISIRGPAAKKYLQSILINSLEKFPVGSMKHVHGGRADLRARHHRSSITTSSDARPWRPRLQRRGARLSCCGGMPTM